MTTRFICSTGRLLAATALSLGTLAGASPALAQAAADGAESPDGGLAEIIVTANRREENLQDVPVSAATLSADAVQSILSAGGEVTALSGHVPGLFIESSNGRAAPRFYIRGLGNTDFDLAASQPVSVVMDDVVLENVTLKAFPIFDIDRVEVLRGPQGTLFGRNTPAGIVKIDTVRPSDEATAQGALSFGSFNTFSGEAAATVPLAPGQVSLRFSGMLQSRSDWIDNGFTGEKNTIGGYDDRAGRVQVLVTPSVDFSILGTVQFRNFTGTSTPFRANILGPGNNDLNANYDRDTVFYDAGGGNVARYKSRIASIHSDYDFGGATLTSITAWARSTGRSRGDIDGGNLVTGPGFIPFPSDTQDSIRLDQFTQEVRLASEPGGPFTWQVGGFYFNSDFDVTTVGFNFPPPVTVRHDNESWALFGQGTFNLGERAKITAGLRYTDDEKDFVVLSGAAPQPRHVQDDRLSWDLSAFFDVTDDASVYAKVASGFRAPTIQGRDVAFFAPPSIATSEKIMSYEAGFKSEFGGRTARINGAVFYYTITDPQFSAVGGAGNLVQLVNADKGRGYGFELDTAFQPTSALTLTAGLSYNNTRIQDPNLLVGTCAQCTVTDPTVVIGTNTRARVDGNPFPNAPKWIADFTARYGVPMGNGGELFAYTDWTYQGATNFFLYESLEFNADNQWEGGLRIGYARLDGDWEIAAFVRNITNADNVKGGIDFNNNTAFVNDPRVFGVSGRLRY
ncbi:TonB-dependent receptor [Tsuneonella sp. YG55]|uniref:TonB-dependent receptor n=1 Tax=Tsuneonella litorea TaxID=2976475 RepID=A0A9X2W2J1_9SPHN|nr:TonB-dependent receptor [Tsuneonella litorea]MCT2559641.1 TonB-dependent receptor [Tsuneonella litorea]